MISIPLHFDLTKFISGLIFIIDYRVFFVARTFFYFYQPDENWVDFRFIEIF